MSYLPEPIGSRSDLFLKGASNTLILTLISGLIGLAIGFGLALAKLSPLFIFRYTSIFLIWFIRGTPLLVQILFTYYALPRLIPSLQLDDFGAALIALSFNIAAYNAEAIRSGILAIPKGQYESAKVLGLNTFQKWRYIILPEAARIALPSLGNNFIGLIKDSSLASSIGLLELSLAGNRVSSETFLPLPSLITVATIYLFFTTISEILLYRLEKIQNKTV